MAHPTRCELRPFLSGRPRYPPGSGLDEELGIGSLALGSWTLTCSLQRAFDPAVQISLLVKLKLESRAPSTRRGLRAPKSRALSITAVHCIWIVFSMTPETCLAGLFEHDRRGIFMNDNNSRKRHLPVMNGQSPGADRLARRARLAAQGWLVGSGGDEGRKRGENH